MLTVDKIQKAVMEIAPKYAINSVKLFGSYADGDATDGSDVDIIIKPYGIFTLFDLVGFQQALSELLNVDVDIVEEDCIPASDLIIEKVVGLYERQEAS